jgi:hypothetical protein
MKAVIAASHNGEPFHVHGNHHIVRLLRLSNKGKQNTITLSFEDVLAVTNALVDAVEELRTKDN